MTAPRSDLLAAMPDLIAGKIGDLLPGLRSASGISGRIDKAAIDRIGVAAPAVLVSQFGARIGTTSAGPQHYYLVDVSAFVITKDAPGLDRDEAAATIVQALLQALPDHRWGEPGLGEMTDIAAHSLVTIELQKAGVALWAVTWRQQVAFTGSPEPQQIPLRLYVSGPAGEDITFGGDA